MEPSIGRIVHYVSYGTPGGEFKPEHRAAIITSLVDPSMSPDVALVDLCVLNPMGMFFNHAVPYDTECSGGSWHWPEIV